MKKDFSHLIKSKNVHTLKTIISIVFVVIGTIVLCTFLAVMQNVSAERSQEKSSKKILEEVDNTLKDNDQTVNSIIFEYNEINQTTISTLAEFANGADILYVVKNSSSMTETELENRINSTTDEIDSICKSISVSGMLVFDSNNKIVLGNDQAYIGPSVSENTYLTEVLTLEQVNILKRYAVDEKGEVTVNGTYLISNGEKEYEPITTTYLGEQVYVYSTLFDKDVDNSYYILTYVPCSLIEKELAGLKSIDSVLSGITVGKSGFLFAIDREDEVFTYFVDGTHDLSGLDYNEYGLTEDAAKDNYTGYQVIDGKKYFCVTREFNSKTYGEFTVVAAVVSQKEIVEKEPINNYFLNHSFRISRRSCVRIWLNSKKRYCRSYLTA